MYVFSRWKRRPLQPVSKPWERTAPVEPGRPVEPVKAQRPHLVETLYLLPKDDLENQRLDFQHHAFDHAVGNHYLAPLLPTSVKSILDVGTGTGIWLVEMGKLFPEADLVGADVELPHPLPAQGIYVKANVLNGLPFADGQITYTHQRFLVAGIPARGWPGCGGGNRSVYA